MRHFLSPAGNPVADAASLDRPLTNIDFITYYYSYIFEYGIDLDQAAMDEIIPGRYGLSLPLAAGAAASTSGRPEHPPEKRH
jgi:hypothetical protein